MTCKTKSTQFDLAMELLIDNGFDGVADAIAIMMNGAMEMERSRYLRAEPYERTDQRRGYANGFKSKSVKTRIGEIQLAVPQTRGRGLLSKQPGTWPPVGESFENRPGRNVRPRGLDS